MPGPYFARFRGSPYVRAGVQVATIGALVIAAVLFTIRLNMVEADRAAHVRKVQVLTTVLTDVCKEASPADLRAHGLLAACAKVTGEPVRTAVETTGNGR